MHAKYLALFSFHMHNVCLQVSASKVKTASAYLAVAVQRLADFLPANLKETRAVAQ